jgi:SsrA-binding protein
MKSIAKNRKAFHEYFIEQKFEAGIALKGSEVKSLRLGHGSIMEAYAFVKNGEVFMVGAYIPLLKHASYMNHSERRERKLLLNKSEIKKLDIATRQKGFTLIPLELYFNKENKVKVELALAVGKALHDKRQVSKEHEAKRDMERALKK